MLIPLIVHYRYDTQAVLIIGISAISLGIITIIGYFPLSILLRKIQKEKKVYIEKYAIFMQNLIQNYIKENDSSRICWKCFNSILTNSKVCEKCGTKVKE